MCGIVGFFDSTMKKDEKEPIISKMMERIKHRGPDSGGKYVTDNIALGFRRLSIIDVAGGSQPIWNEDNTKAILFNGEIYNFQPLYEELVQYGHKFKTHADTEVLLHGYEQWGMKGLLKRVRGMFAFVIWDNKTEELVGARDFFGIKPFYIYQNDGAFLFGSEIKAFLEHPKFKKELNIKALKPYMTLQYSALPETFFKGVYRLPEGHYFKFKKGHLSIEKYWDIYFDSHKMNLDDAVDMIDKAVSESVRSHKISEVPVGSLLSSGVDSSYVTSLLKPEYTFSVGFDSQKYHECDEAKKLTNKLGLKNKDKIISAEDTFNNFPLIQYHLDEPDANPSCVPLYFLTRLARKYVTVILSGEGADELFCGYANYGYHTRSHVIRILANDLKKLPRGVRIKLAHSLKKVPNFPGRLHLYENLAPAEEFFIGQAKIFGEDEANDYLKPKYQNSVPIHSIVMKYYDKVSGYKDEVKKMQYLDIHMFMQKDILLKADKLSMANSTELRVPFLDKKVASVAEKIPTKYELTSENNKFALREAANRHLPSEWADREKLGFPVPIKDWLESDTFYNKVRSLFSEKFVSQFFNQRKILELLDATHEKRVNGRRKVWVIYTFLVWYKVYFIDTEIPKYIPSNEN